MSRILVVDDDPMIVAGVTMMLDLHDLATEGVCDAAAAEELIGHEFFPVILADLRLRTEEEGMRLLESIRRLSPRSRVATMTGYADADTERRLRERGSHLVLHKPLEEEKLIAALRDMLAAVESSEAEHGDDLEALYLASRASLHAVSRGRYGFTHDETEELMQEAWVLYLEKRNAVRTPKAWLTGTIANLCRQEIDRRQRERSRSGEMIDLPLMPKTDSTLVLEQGLSRLDERSRNLCRLIGMEQRTYEEVSAATGLPIGSIGPLYIRAKKRLRDAITN
jgi:RNA polymerase sigma factor (sigma-70 family)